MLVSPRWEHVGVAFGILGLITVGSVCMLAQAYRMVPRATDRNINRPWVAAFLSALIPGLGQLYNRQIVIAFLLFGGVAVMLFLRGFVASVGLNLLEIGAVLQAYRRGRALSSSTSDWTTMLTTTLAGGLVLALCFDGTRAFVMQPFRVPTNAMSPTIRGISTLPDGAKTAADRIICDKLVYRLRAPRRGDIVVFRTDEIPDLAKSPRAAYYAKRIAGLPGERVSIQPPYLYINGQRVTDPPIFETIARAEDGYFGYVLPHTFPPPRYLASETDSVQLGKDEYFVLGDNSPSSLDSRFWGPVPRRSLVGPVTKIYWPLDRMGIIPE